MTFSMLYAFTENFVLPLSHDEVVHGKGSLINKMPGDLWQQFANLRLLYAYFYGASGQENALHGRGVRPAIGMGLQHQPRMESISPFPEHQGMQRLVSDLNELYRREPALHEVDFDWHGFDWIDCDDAAASILSFMRRAKTPEDFAVVIVQISRPFRTRDTAWACPNRATIANFSTRMPNTMAGAILAMAAA